jgi:mRNA interferase RelE/StbE
LRGYGKFRVGPYRLICHRDDAVLLVLVIKVDHRRDVYR